MDKYEAQIQKFKKHKPPTGALTDSLTRVLRIDDVTERSEFSARLHATGFQPYEDQQDQEYSSYGLLYVLAMLSINVGIAHPSGVLDMVIASTHDEYQFLRMTQSEGGDEHIAVRDDRDDDILSRIYKMPVIGTRHVHQDVFSSKFTVRRIIDGLVRVSTGNVKGHRLRLYRSSGITSGPHLMRLAKKREARREVRNLFAPLPIGKDTIGNVAKATEIGASRALKGRVPPSNVP